MLAWLALYHEPLHWTFIALFIRVSPYALSLDHNSSIYASLVAGMMGTCYTLRFYCLRWGLVNFFFPQAGLKLESSQSLPPE
jgi:hypothetical protein